MTIKKIKGFVINQTKCIKCGLCMRKCSFNAIEFNNEMYNIRKDRCDECGDCYINCPKKAIQK